MPDPRSPTLEPVWIYSHRAVEYCRRGSHQTPRRRHWVGPRWHRRMLPGSRHSTNSSVRELPQRRCATPSSIMRLQIKLRMREPVHQTGSCIHCSFSVPPQEDNPRELPCAARWLPGFIWGNSESRQRPVRRPCLLASPPHPGHSPSATANTTE